MITTTGTDMVMVDMVAASADMGIMEKLRAMAMVRLIRFSLISQSYNF